jgi:outer membrane protein insertion porin family
VRKRLPGGGPAAAFGFLFIALAMIGPGAARAQTVPSTPDTVTSVRVTGNTTVDGGLILRGFGVPVGTRFSMDAVRRGIRRLYDLGFFNDVSVDADRQPGGVGLLIQVVENPRVGAVEFSGNKKVKEKDILEATGPLQGKMADDKLLAKVDRAANQVYREKGYTKAQVSSRYLPGDSSARRILLVQVDEGPKMRVEAIRFVGMSQMEEDDLRDPMKQGTTGFLKGGVYKPEVVEEDVERIEAGLAENGFRDGKVTGYEVLPGSKEDRVILEFTVVEGPRYHVGTVGWEGNEALPTGALMGLTKVEPLAVFNQQKVQKTVEEAYGLYADIGYIYLSIRPDYVARDSTVDVVFQVTEGEPSHIRDIIITGNTRTREYVIRRQLAVRPGDLFTRNALIRSQRELQQLGYFSNMQVDYKPVPESSDIDLTMEVEEKQVGTASAGFGFSSSVGLTGFIELGHSNLFGKGQTLNLRVERGSERSNANISLTEPWFMGSPTTLGIDLFTTTTRYRGPTTDIESRRSGGALRVGRPLPIPYTRVFGTYALQREKLNEGDLLGQTTTGFQLARRPTVSSSLTLSVVRNSTNHPIYPTVGSKSRLAMEFSGGPLGGDQVFQKYELDVAGFFPSFRVGNWGPTLMLRGRFGAVGDAFRDVPLNPQFYVPDPLLPTDAAWDTLAYPIGPGMEIPVPRYTRIIPPESTELFRMGGTTYDPLRGYEDFEIVPEENVARQFFVNTVPDTLTGLYTVRGVNSFYPGGMYMAAFTAEMQFLIAEPLHGLVFGDAGATWNSLGEFQWDTWHPAVGLGVRLEIPLLGLVGFDYAYGFNGLNRSTGQYNRGRWVPHLQFGRVF